MAVKNFLGVFGHVVLDHIVTVPHLPAPNTSIQTADRRRYFGGPAGNLARSAARLGVRTSLASFVGSDFPADYRAALVADGVDLRDLRVVRGGTTPTAWVFSDRKGNQFALVDQGAMRETARRPILRHSVADVDLVHIGTGRPEYYARIVRRAQDLGRTIAFDPSQEIHYAYRPGHLRTLLASATYFFANEAEIARAKRLLRANSTADLLRFTEVIVATLGAKGSVVMTRSSRIRIPRVRPRRVVDVTGAGDAYRAGFYAGLSRGYDLRRCGILASAVASFVVEARGTQTNLPLWPQVLARARRHASF